VPPDTEDVKVIASPIFIFPAVGLIEGNGSFPLAWTSAAKPKQEMRKARTIMIPRRGNIILLFSYGLLP
jgi:hypothetical protein